MKAEEVISFKSRLDFKEHLERKARQNDMTLSRYIKKVLEKHSKFKAKDPEIV